MSAAPPTAAGSDVATPTLFESPKLLLRTSGRTYLQCPYLLVHASEAETDLARRRLVVGVDLCGGCAVTAVYGESGEGDRVKKEARDAGKDSGVMSKNKRKKMERALARAAKKSSSDGPAKPRGHALTGAGLRRARSVGPRLMDGNCEILVAASYDLAAGPSPGEDGDADGDSRGKRRGPPSEPPVGTGFVRRESMHLRTVRGTVVAQVPDDFVRVATESWSCDGGVDTDGGGAASFFLPSFLLPSDRGDGKTKERSERTARWSTRILAAVGTSGAKKMWVPVPADVTADDSDGAAARTVMLGLLGSSVAGAVADGLHCVGPDDRAKALRAALGSVPPGTRTAVFFTDSVREVLELACEKTRVDVVGTDLPVLLARAGRALALEMQISEEDIVTTAAAAPLRVGGCLDLRGDARYDRDYRVVLEGCPCAACAGGHTRAYLRHLLLEGEMLGEILLFRHNLVHLLTLMECADGARRCGQTDVLLKHVGAQILP